MDKEKKRRAVYDLRKVIYNSGSVMSEGAMKIITALCLKAITKEQAVTALINNTVDCIFIRDKFNAWWETHEKQAYGFVNLYKKQIILDDGCDASEMLRNYNGEVNLDVDIQIPIRNIYFVAKKINWLSNYRTKSSLYNTIFVKQDLARLRREFLSSIEYTELYRGRKKSKRYTVSRDKDRPVYYVSAKGRLAKLPMYKFEKYTKEKKIVYDHEEWRATETIPEGQYIKVGSFLQKYFQKIPKETKEMLQRAFEEVRPCQMVIDTDFKKAYDPIYNNHQDTDGDKASNYSCMSGQGDYAQEFYGKIHGCKVVRFETDRGDQVGRCIMYEYKGERHFIRIYGVYEYHRTMINLLQNEMHENDMFGRDCMIEDLELETDWTDETHSMYLDGNHYGARRVWKDDHESYVVTTKNIDFDLKTTGHDILEYLEDNYCTCDYCGERCPDDEAYWVFDNCYCCEECANKDGYYRCEKCGEWENEDDGIFIDNLFYCCDECAERDGYRRCENCGEWHDGDDMLEPESGTYYCDSECAEADGWLACVYCDGWVHKDDAIKIGDKIYCCEYCAEKDGWELKDGEWKRAEDVEQVKEQEEPKEVVNEG